MLKKQYPFLDGLRGVTILWVIIFHLNVIPAIPNAFIQTLISKIIQAGHYGVDIFFVISGFLITGLILPDADNKLDVGKFFIRRAFKILPSYYFCVICLFAFNYLAQTPQSWGDFLRYITFTTFHWPNEFGHLWSIGVEENFYLVYPFIVYVIFKYSPGHNSARLTLLKFLSVALAASTLYKMTASLPNNTLANIDALGAGCIIKILEPQLTNIPQKYKRMLSKMCLGVGLLLWFLLMSGWQEHYMRLFNYVASGFLIIAGLLECGSLNSILEAKLLRFIGKISYNLYLWHYPILILAPTEFRNNHSVFVPFYFVSTFLMGWLTTVFLEQFFLNLRESKTGRKQGTPAFKT